MGAAEKSWAARAQKLAIYCIQVAVKKKKKYNNNRWLALNVQ